MNSQTTKRRLGALLTSITTHPHKRELIKLMRQQVADDTYKVSSLDR
jgi:hypothetical protein